MNGPAVSLTLSGDQHEQLRRHLFPGDGKEAVAVALCGRRAGPHRHRLTVQKIFNISLAACTERTFGSITWPTELIEPLLNEAEAKSLSVVKIHSHPGGYRAFSGLDDTSDHRLLPAVRGWVEADIPHGSVIFLPDGEMFGRFLWRGDRFEPFVSINVAGPDLRFWHAAPGASPASPFLVSQGQAFGQGTTDLLARLSVAVVGCSGTGSPVIEQLVRLGVGEIVLVDFDRMEDRNVNRIINSTVEDAKQGRLKVDVQADAVARLGFGTRVVRVIADLWTREAVDAVAGCDVAFGCMDTASGRYLLNLLATYYGIPYFDLGVRLDAVPEGPTQGHIREVCGTVHYLMPGRSSLVSRGLVTMERVQAERLRLRDPEAYARQLDDGYIRGVEEHRPAVVSVNMFIAALAVNDFLARLHPYREQPNSEVASIEFSLASLEFFPDPERRPCPLLEHVVGKGDVEPRLGLPALAGSEAL